MNRVTCPYCGHSSTVNDPRPGKFRPECTQCHRKFLLVVKTENDGVSLRSWTMEAVEEKLRQTKGTAPATEETRLASADKSESPGRQAPSPTRHSAPGARGADAPTRAAVSATSPSDGNTAVEQQPAASSGHVPERLGGYRIVRELGRGGLGVVYLAHQISLDRQVALKTIQGSIADHPQAVSRFIREAYAAAQLVHHNVVQIHDLSRDGDVNFFSMEYVPGSNLAELVKRDGPMESRQAAGLILQAARGLLFAHRQGMIHRDIKPANLMLSELGVVKVADLGLVKLAGDADEHGNVEANELARLSAENLTTAGSALGTVLYMAPEQADNSAGIDHRADIYSLGCTLYVLLTGKPPFQGKTALDVITQHKSAAVVRPDTGAAQVDGMLADIAMRMMAKRPEDRHNSLAEVIQDLEQYLGLSSADFSRPDPRHVELLERTVKDWRAVPLAGARDWAPAAFAGLCLVLAVASALVSWRWASGVISLAMVAPLAWFVLAGFRERGPLFARARELVFRAPLRRWIAATGALLLLIVVLLVTGLLAIWIVFAIVGVALAAIYHFAIESQLAARREEIQRPLERFLASQRAAGADENALQEFVVRFGGRNQEELFEELFGYDALRRARRELSASGAEGKRKRFRPWRDWLIDRLERRLRVSRQTEDAARLARVEREALVAAGVAPEAADAQARHFADALVREAVQWRSHAATRGSVNEDPAAAAAKKRERIKRMLAEARGGKTRPVSLSQRLQGPLDALLGGHVRLIAGCLLVAGCAMWVRQNELLDRISAEQLRATAASAIENRGANLSELAEQAGVNTAVHTEPWSFPVVGGWFDSLLPGVAGVLLVFSSLFGGWKITLLMIPATLVAWLGPTLGVPSVGSMLGAEWVSAAAGLLLTIAAIGIGRRV